MPGSKVLSPILILIALFMGLRHGILLLRSTPDQLQAGLNLSLDKTTITLMGMSTIAGGVLLLFPSTFLAANVISGCVIFFMAAAQTNARHLHGALIELPFLLLPLLLLYVGYPSQSHP